MFPRFEVENMASLDEFYAWVSKKIGRIGNFRFRQDFQLDNLKFAVAQLATSLRTSFFFDVSERTRFQALCLLDALLHERKNYLSHYFKLSQEYEETEKEENLGRVIEKINGLRQDLRASIKQLWLERFTFAYLKLEAELAKANSALKYEKGFIAFAAFRFASSWEQEDFKPDLAFLDRELEAYHAHCRGNSYASLDEKLLPRSDEKRIKMTIWNTQEGSWFFSHADKAILIQQFRFLKGANLQAAQKPCGKSKVTCYHFA